MRRGRAILVLTSESEGGLRIAYQVDFISSCSFSEAMPTGRARHGTWKTQVARSSCLEVLHLLMLCLTRGMNGEGGGVDRFFTGLPLTIYYLYTSKIRPVSSPALLVHAAFFFFTPPLLLCLTGTLLISDLIFSCQLDVHAKRTGYIDNGDTPTSSGLMFAMSRSKWRSENGRVESRRRAQARVFR